MVKNQKYLNQDNDTTKNIFHLKTLKKDEIDEETSSVDDDHKDHNHYKNINKQIIEGIEKKDKEINGDSVNIKHY